MTRRKMHEVLRDRIRSLRERRNEAICEILATENPKPEQDDVGAAARSRTESRPDA